MADSSELTFFPTSKSHDTKLGQIPKIPLIKFRYCALRICGQLPAPIVNGRGDSCWKWLDFQLWRARDLDVRSSHTAYRHASLIDLYLHANLPNFIESEQTFCGQTDNIHMDEHLRPALLGRLCWSVNLIKIPVVSVQNVIDASLHLLRRHFLNFIIHRHYSNYSNLLSTDS